MDDHPHIELGTGDHKVSLPCYPQPHTRIIRRLGRVIDSVRDAVGDDGIDPETLIRTLSLRGRLYETFETFVPQMRKYYPEYLFAGYVSKAAQDADDWDEDSDPSPTFPQFVAAFRTVVEVNGGYEFIEGLGKVLDLRMVKAELTLALSEWRESLSIGSPNSLGMSGESPQSSSTTTPPTSEPVSGKSEIDSLDFVPRSEWMHAPSGEPLTTSA